MFVSGNLGMLGLEARLGAQSSSANPFSARRQYEYGVEHIPFAAGTPAESIKHLSENAGMEEIPGSPAVKPGDETPPTTCIGLPDGTSSVLRSPRWEGDGHAGVPSRQSGTPHVLSPSLYFPRTESCNWSLKWYFNQG